HQLRVGQRTQDVGVAQNVKHRVGDAVGRFEIDGRVALDLVAHVHHVAQHREQVLADALDDLPVDEGGGRRALYFQLDAALLRHHADVERTIALQQFLAVVQLVAAVENRQRTV